MLVRFLWLGSSLLLLASCITDGTDGPSDSIYYKSQAQADAALEAFDKANPSCQLWTNWQKMCSRTGPNGETWCTTDPDRPVKPSVPFCAGDGKTDFGVEVQIKGEMEKQSARRFCVDVKFGERVRRCFGKETGRPFNGRNLGLVRNPLCEVWSEDDTAICAEGERFPELPRCSKRLSFRSNSVLHCARINTKIQSEKHCKSVILSKEGSPYPPVALGPDAPIILRGETKADSFVHTIYCGEFSK